MSDSPEIQEVTQLRQQLDRADAGWSTTIKDLMGVQQQLDEVQARVQALEAALGTITREAERVANDHHRPRYTRLDESIVSAQRTLATLTQANKEAQR